MGRRTKIFISYRRDDASGDARSVYQALERRFGAKRLFMDVDSIKRGSDFREVLEAHLAASAVMLVLIGRNWLDLAGPDGRRRLDDPADFVRLEIATALREKLALIPVLLDGALMPGAEALPADLQGLAYRQAVELRHRSFKTDMFDLQSAVRDALGEAGSRGGSSSGSGGLIAAGVVAALAIGGGAVWWSLPPNVPPQTELSLTGETEPQSFEDRLKAAGKAGLKECDACPEMVAIPGGRFTMGSLKGEKDRQGDEGPTRSVSIAPFALGRDAVTVAEFRRFARATRRKMTRCYTLKAPSGTAFGWVDAASWENPGFRQQADHPAVCVSWEDAKAYVAWLNGQVAGAPYRLPSEAEQEYVLRADHGAAAYSWGGGKNEGCRYANGADRTAKGRFPGWTVSTCDDGYVFTAPMGAFPANKWGVRQLSGNVWEWGEDCWNNSYSGAPSDGSAWRSGDCSRAVLRGGSWVNDPLFLRSAFRFRYSRSIRYYFVGFRVSRTLAD